MQNYIESFTLIQYTLLEYLDSEENIEEDFQKLNYAILQNQIEAKKHDFSLFLSMLMKICNNHKRSKYFFQKIEQLLIYHTNSIRKQFSNIEIFNLFRSNKRILLFLIESKVLILDDIIISIMKKPKYKSMKYPEYFCLDNNTNSNDHAFIKKRLDGENDNYICQLIRKDLLDDFIKYIEQNYYPVDSTVQPSIFETNNLFLKRNPTLLEYSMFYDSFKIFSYIILNKAQLTPYLWTIAIHSNNEDNIKFLIQNCINPEDETYEQQLKESIKCHHNSITKFIQSNLLEESIEIFNQENEFYFNIYSYCFHYRNFFFFPKDYNQKYMFFYLCYYDYYTLIDFYLKVKTIDINNTIPAIVSNILNSVLLLMFMIFYC